MIDFNNIHFDPQKSVFSKMLLIFFVLLMTVVSISSVFFYMFFSRTVFVEFESRGRSIVKSLSLNCIEGLNSGEIAQLDIPLQAAGQEEDVIYSAVYGRGGMLFSHFGDTNLKRLEEHTDLIGLLPGKVKRTISNNIYDFYYPVRKSELGFQSNDEQQDQIGSVRIGLSPLRLQRQRRLIINYYLGSCLLLLALSVIIGIFFVRRFAAPISIVSATIENVGLKQADLSQRLPENGHDEIAVLARGFNKFCDNLSSIINKVSGEIPLLEAESMALAASLEQLMASSREIGAAGNNISHSSKEQLERITQISGQISTAAIAGQDILSLTAEIQKVSSLVSEVSFSGNAEAAEMAEKILHITEVIDMQVAAVDKLMVNSRAIVSIVKTIEEISHKTDMLAINTAIEASRSSNSNAGFNVIATEIRTLSLSSMQYADNIEGIVSTLLEDIATLSENSKKTKSAIDSSRQTLMATSQRLNDINHHMVKLNNQIIQIAVLQRENHSLIDQAKQGLEITTLNASKNALAATQVSTSLHEKNTSILKLKETAEIIFDHSKRLRSIVALFKTK